MGSLLIQGPSGRTTREVLPPTSLRYSPTLFEEILARNIRLRISVAQAEELSRRHIGTTQRLEELGHQLIVTAQDLTAISRQEKVMLT